MKRPELLHGRKLALIILLLLGTTCSVLVTQAAEAAPPPEAPSTPRPAPTITAFNPTSGTSGTKVTLSGTNFTGATFVALNGKAAKYAINSDTQITATVPANATSGRLTVSTASGTATGTSPFTVVGGAAPSVTNFSPTKGGPGTKVKVYGTNFAGTNSVAFDGTNASYTVDSSTQITATVPSGASSGPLTTTSGSGTATSSQSFQMNTAPATWSGGFETGDLSEWDNSWQEAPGRFTTVKSDGGVRPRTGAYMGRVEVRQGDDPINTGGNICEVYRYGNVPGHYDVVGDDRYYAFSLYLPAGFPYVPNSLFNYFFELHGDDGGQAPIKIGINSIISGQNPSVGFVAELESGNSPQAPTQTLWRLGDLVTGQWVDFVIHVHWAQNNTGAVEVWENGVQKVSAPDIQTWYSNGMGAVKPQLGYYRAAYSQTAVLYLDAAKIGSSYASVQP